ncbi:hypothetical protein BD410DRAFT_846693 [Rickenella mellea]|uniref:Uncharacterized protein n=1 Tax=Rickenella mellea TaxID=50990 RepID=A0A4Y7PG33_9AGAM|nr:hypothetical protein BD410DRAFT_846943 [Rickenella mellea]TDL13701.1 hypothetical protein BD410DRAFT_846693 [Rickenella mellea]
MVGHCSEDPTHHKDIPSAPTPIASLFTGALIALIAFTVSSLWAVIMGDTEGISTAAHSRLPFPPSELAQASAHSSDGAATAPDDGHPLNPALANFDGSQTTPADQFAPPPAVRTPDAHQKYYVITKGRRVGIFTNILVVRGLVDGISGGAFVKCPSLAQAHRSYSQAKRMGYVRAVHDNNCPGTPPPSPVIAHVPAAPRMVIDISDLEDDSDDDGDHDGDSLAEDEGGEALDG